MKSNISEAIAGNPNCEHMRAPNTWILTYETPCTLLIQSGLEGGGSEDGLGFVGLEIVPEFHNVCPSSEEYGCAE